MLDFNLYKTRVYKRAMSVIHNFTEQTVRKQAAKDGITHISTGIAVAKDGKILMVRRAPNDTFGAQFELPGGGVDPGEDIIDGALRELKEETNITAMRVVTVFKGFDYTTSKKPKVRQFNFLVEAAEPIDIILNPAEHDAVRWVDTKDIAAINMSQSMRVCVQDALALASQDNV